MRVCVPAALWLAFLGGLVFPSRSLADPFHYQTLPLGQRALGMGGAFTGLANDPSAAYYNPAGLAQITDSALSASLTINAFDRRTVVRGYRTRIGSSALEHDSQPSLPVFVTLVKKVGRRDADRKRKHAVALSTFTIDQRRLSFDLEQRGDVAGRAQADTFSASRDDITIWNGVSYAYRVSERLAYGISGFLSLTRTRYDQEHIAVTLGTLDRTTGSYSNQGSVWEAYRARSEVRNIVARVGVLYQYSSNLRLGVMLQPPSIHVRGTADVRTRILTSDILATPATGRFTNVSESGLTSHNPLPWELRLGASYQPLDWITVAFDTSLYGANGTKSNPIVTIGPRRPDSETGAIASAGDLALESWYRTMTANVALGCEAVIENTVALRGGLFTSLSAAPSVPRVSETYYTPDVNLYGGAFSAGYVANGYDLSLGVAGLIGWGDGVAHDTQVAPEIYRRTEVFDRTLFIFLSGAKSAVNKLASTAQKKLQQIRREIDAENAKAEREAARVEREAARAEREAARKRRAKSEN